MAYDNTLKYLVEQDPEPFVQWLLGTASSDVQVLKTELSLEPIRADSVTFLQTSQQILHLEFQTLPQSSPSLPLRMLDYWVRLYRQYNCKVVQVVIFLKPTTSEAVFVDRFTAPRTFHHYRVIRTWEEDPAPLLVTPSLLPIAVLARTTAPNALLQQVAAQVDMIESIDLRQNISTCAQLLAGLVFNHEQIHQFFRRDMMKESVVYQEILREGLQEGLQQGLQQGLQAEINLLVRQLTHRLGTVPQALQNQIQGLSIAQLEDLGEALLDFSSQTELENWLSRLKG
ncbi:MAG: Rpn family recombination-promoting nuclease/putative transposase [Verrucomicrobia bacterium]|nr:Rpn family recombination-promoting nuclease/putative transposase [Leptolyngbya sp. ES-bin-22]